LDGLQTTSLRYGRVGADGHQICAPFEVLDLLVVFAGEGFDVNCWDIAKFSAQEFLFEEVVAPGEVGKLPGDFVVDGFEVTLVVLGDAGGEVGFGFSVPSDEGGFGDAQAAGDAGKAQALDTEAEEFVMGGGGVHGEGKGE
jgi:hypothetical protein